MQRDASCHSTGTPSSTCPAESPARTAPSCSPTAAPTSSKSKHPRVIRCAAGRRPGPRSTPGEDGALFSFLAGAKHSVVVDPGDADDLDMLDGLLGRRRCGGVVARIRGRRTSTRSRPRRFADRHPHLIVTAITPFGLDGPWRDRPATEFTAAGVVGRGDRHSAAARRTGRRCSSVVRSATGWPVRTPRGPGVPVRAAARRAGELIDLSMLEAQILCLTYYPVTYFEMLGRPWRTERRPTVPGVATAADGLVALGLRHRAAVVRPVRDVRPRRVDRRGVRR